MRYLAAFAHDQLLQYATTGDIEASLATTQNRPHIRADARRRLRAQITPLGSSIGETGTSRSSKSLIERRNGGW
jgi:hypothetical protein